MYYAGRTGDRPGPISIIRDANLGVDYVIYRQLNNCTVLPRSNGNFVRYFQTFEGSSDLVASIASPEHILFYIPLFEPFSYEGVSTIRGVDVDSWIGFRDSIAGEFDTPRVSGISVGSNLTFEIFFTRQGWRITNDRAVSSEPQFWRMVVKGNSRFTNYTDNVTTHGTISAVYDIFDFSTEEPDFDIFDVSTCLPPSEYLELSLTVPGHERGLDFSQLRRNLRSAIVNYTSIQHLQVGNIQVSFNAIVLCVC